MLLTGGLLAALALARLDGFSLNLQGRKFPPSAPYPLYSLPSLFAFLLARALGLGECRGAPASGLAWCGRNVFAIYLVQGVVCSLPYLFLSKLTDSDPDRDSRP